MYRKPILAEKQSHYYQKHNDLANYLGWRRLLDRFKDNLTPQQFLFHALRTSYQ